MRVLGPTVLIRNILPASTSLSPSITCLRLFVNSFSSLTVTPRLSSFFGRSYLLASLVLYTGASSSSSSNSFSYFEKGVAAANALFDLSFVRAFRSISKSIYGVKF